MRSLIIIFLCAFAFTANAQSIEKIRIEDNLSVDKQYFPVSYNGKKLLSNDALPKIKKRKGFYNSILLQDLVNEIKKQVRTEISDSIATVSGGGVDTANYYEYIARIYQSGTDDPIAFEFTNTFPDTVEWIRAGDGVYNMEINGIAIDASTDSTWVSFPQLAFDMNTFAYRTYSLFPVSAATFTLSISCNVSGCTIDDGSFDWLVSRGDNGSFPPLIVWIRKYFN